MTTRLPMFPLNAVLFPGVTISLHVFEDRYRALVHHLLRISDPNDRMFGTVAIREGYEVGEHGSQSLFRVGVRVRLGEVTSHPDGTFDIEVVGVDRLELERLDTTGNFPVGEVRDHPEATGQVSSEVAEQARAVFTAYRAAMMSITGDPLTGALPSDPTFMSWVICACTPLPLSERQELLEAEDTGDRLALVTSFLRSELRAMNVIPSLPATQVARTRWSPN